MRTRIASFALASLFALPVSAAGDELSVGDPAPELKVGTWVKGEPVKAFAPGQTYVVEFWATWCGPCKKAIPHISNMQKAYGDQVRFIGVSIWEDEPDNVAKFVMEKADDMAYTVATDLVAGESEGFMAETWMDASDQHGIPRTFIVDSKGRLAWIGHPMEMDTPLEKIVAGEWDIAQAREEFVEKREIMKRYRTAYDDMHEAMKAGEWKTAVAAADQAIAVLPEREGQVGMTKFEALLRTKAFDGAYAYATRLTKEIAKDDAGALNALAWTIVDPEALWIEKRDLSVALMAAERADLLTEHESAPIVDTLALIHFEMGHVEKAIMLQERAVSLAKGTAMEAELKGRLDHFRKAGETQGV